MQLVRARSRHDAHLCAVTLAVARAVGVGHYIELAHCIHAQQLATRAARSHVDQRGTRVFDSVEQKQIVLRPAPAHAEHVAHRRVRTADPARPLAGVIHRRRIQCQQLVVAAPVQWQRLHLALVDEPRGLLRGDVNAAHFGIHHHILVHVAHAECKIHHLALAHHQHNARLLLWRKAFMRHFHCVIAHRHEGVHSGRLCR